MTESNNERQLHRLIYASVPRADLKLQDLKAILATSIENNTRDQLTGALFFSEDYFLQILEGARVPLSDTFSRILKDDRHAQVCLMEFVPCSERQFSSWAMRNLPYDKEMLMKAAGKQSFKPLGWTANQCYSFLTKYSALVRE